MAGKGPKLGVLTIYMEKPEILVGKSMVHTILFGKVQKIWACDLRGCFFLIILVCSANLFILCSGLYSLHTNFYRYNIFMHKIWCV